MSKKLEFLTTLADHVGKELLTYFNPDGIPAILKADKTTLTEADTKADQIITSTIGSEFPDDLIISEESSLSLDSIQGSVWVVDPLDGTTNFSLGFPYWGVSIARVTDGVPELAAAYFPVLGELYTAENGVGAFLNGKVIKSHDPDKFRPQNMMVCSGNAQSIYKIRLPYKKRTMGSAVYDFCLVARGTATFGIQNKSKIWDIAAGYLIIKESGAEIKFINELQPFPLKKSINYNDVVFPSFMATTQNILEDGIKNINKRERCL